MNVDHAIATCILLPATHASNNGFRLRVNYHFFDIKIVLSS